jgi:hypothetical protein
VAASTGLEVRGAAVDAATEPEGAAALDLVGHGVGEGLGGMGRVDPVAVQVQPGVQLGQGQRAVGAQDRQGHRAQTASAQRDGLGIDHR